MHHIYIYLVVIAEERGIIGDMMIGGAAEIVHDLADDDEHEREGESVDDGPKEAQCHEPQIDSVRMLEDGPNRNRPFLLPHRRAGIAASSSCTGFFFLMIMAAPSHPTPFPSPKLSIP